MEFSRLFRFIPPIAIILFMWVSFVKGISPMVQAAGRIKNSILPKTGQHLINHMGVKRGDVIVGINGIEYSSPRKAFEVVFNSKEDQLKTLTIVRNGRKVILKNQ